MARSPGGKAEHELVHAVGVAIDRVGVERQHRVGQGRAHRSARPHAERVPQREGHHLRLRRRRNARVALRRAAPLEHRRTRRRLPQRRRAAAVARGPCLVEGGGRKALSLSAEQAHPCGLARGADAGDERVGGYAVTVQVEGQGGREALALGGVERRALHRHRRHGLTKDNALTNLEARYVLRHIRGGGVCRGGHRLGVDGAAKPDRRRRLFAGRGERDGAQPAPSPRGHFRRPPCLPFFRIGVRAGVGRTGPLRSRPESRGRTVASSARRASAASST
jgi:hypothetical protein